MAKVVPVARVSYSLAEHLSDVADRRDHVIVTRNGRPAAALIPVDEYDALEETAELLSDPATIAAIDAGLKELASGEVVSFDDVKAELAHRRKSR